MTIICLNMIVKNEAATLPRCLSAIAPHIGAWVIADTGSTDGTPDLIRCFFEARGIPGELHDLPFHDFAQARNAALDHAAASTLQDQYLLLADADMELVVEDQAVFAALDRPAYRVIQRSGGLTYWNTRLVRRSTRARYVGVTHEYLDVPEGTAALSGLWFNDHADGANRADKFSRDIRLLGSALRTDPDNGRSWFYLAQSYRDSGRAREAADAYARRAGMAGWAEETWYARWQLARCLLTLGDDAGFLREALATFEQRPWRAEPLHDIARHYRERGMNELAVLYAEAGLAIPWPDQDVLFVDAFPYTSGLREEYSIAGFYTGKRQRAHGFCDELALSRTAPEHTRDLARSNLFHYAEPAGTLFPSFTARRIEFTPPDGYHAMNPSVARCGDRLVVSQRAVNYSIGDDGRYLLRDDEVIRTRNFLLRLADDMAVESSVEILPPADMPPPLYDWVRGFEDCRLFAWRGALWCSATARELNAEGWCEQVLARIDTGADLAFRLADWRVMAPDLPRQHQKNWMPLVDGETLRFVYGCDPVRIVDEAGRVIAGGPTTLAADGFRGGSQMVRLSDGWLALIHEVTVNDGRRHYWHRFVSFSPEFDLIGTSPRFYFQEKGIEFAAGLALSANDACALGLVPPADALHRRLIISYGARDAEAWLAIVDLNEVLSRLRPAASPPPNSRQHPT